MSQAERIILMRSAEDDAGFRGAAPDRPLSPRGRSQARAAARAMHERGHHPGPLLVSTARAARETAAIIAAELQIPDSDVHYGEQLIEAGPEVLEAQITVLAVPYTLVTAITDNPGVSELARFLARDPGAAELQPAEWRHLPWPSPY